MKSEIETKKICFVHVPAERKIPSIKLLPLGLLALADYLKKNGFDPVVLHLGLEKTINPKFQLSEFLKKEGMTLVLFDLHWHQQSFSCLNECFKLKRRQKNISVILGGFTASFFYKEILKDFKQVDFIVRGDAEIPLKMLLAKLVSRKTEFSGIPNVSWRKGRSCIHNRHSYVAGRFLFSKLSFVNFSLLLHNDVYIKMFSTGLGQYDKEPIFYYTPGRGCSVSCSFCGGSSLSQKIINHRTRVLLNKVSSVVRDFKKITGLGFKKINICFDPFPDSLFYLKLFHSIRESCLDLNMDFECFRLPNRHFIDSFVKTFGSASSLTISPETGSDRVRRLNKGMFYTNKELFDVLRYLDKKNIRIYIAFTAGLPFENKDDVVATLMLINKLRNSFKNVEINAEMISIEPAAPWFLKNKGFGIKLEKKHFVDFFQGKSNDLSLGYTTDFFSQDDLCDIMRLYRAEAKCIFKISFFLRTLVNQKIKVSARSYNKYILLCRDCFNFNNCFMNKDIRSAEA
jgi:radical SAM superfamily enzyme YgiQ (UPF0313 family)